MSYLHELPDFVLEVLFQGLLCLVVWGFVGVCLGVGCFLFVGSVVCVGGLGFVCLFVGVDCGGFFLLLFLL